MKELYNELQEYWDCELLNDEIFLDDYNLVITENYEYNLLDDNCRFYRIDRDNKTIATLIKDTDELIQEIELIIEE